MTSRRPSAVAVAILGVLALAALAGCRSDPSVAAYVGPSEITEKRVDGVVDELRTSLEGEIDQELEGMDENADVDPEQLRQQRQGEIDQNLEGLRDRVLEMLVLTEAGAGYADAEGITVSDPAPDQIAEQVGLAADHGYVAVVAGFVTVMNALQEEAGQGEVTEAEQREVYENIQLDGQQLPPFEQVQPVLTVELLGGPIAIRDLLVEAVDRAHVTVNPQYDLVYQVPVPLGQANSWLGVPIGEQDDVVRDAD